MYNNSWIPNQSTEANMDTVNWRDAIQHDARQRVVNKTVDMLKSFTRIPNVGLHELRRIAQNFEGKIFTVATSKDDYLRKISLKLLEMQHHYEDTMAPNQGGPSNKSCDASNIASQPWSLGQTPIQNVGLNNSNIQNIAGQNLVGHTIDQNSNMQNIFAGSQSQIQGMQQILRQKHQQQQQQQLMPQTQSQPAQLLQQQPNLLQQDIQQRVQASGPLLQQPSVLDQQKQLYHSQRPFPETSSTSLDSTALQSSGGDWQEETFQKIKSMKECYLSELNEIYQKITSKLEQHHSLPQLEPDKLEKLKVFKVMLERIITFLQVSKSNVSPSFKEKLGSYETQLMNFINANRPRNPLQSGQLPPPHTHSMSQSQPQVTQVQSNENQINFQLQATNMQDSVAMMQLHMASLTLFDIAQSNTMNSTQPSTNLESDQEMQ